MPTQKIKIKSSGKVVMAERQEFGKDNDVYYVYEKPVYISKLYSEDETELIK